MFNNGVLIMERYKRLEEIDKKIAQLQRERDTIEQSINQEHQEDWNRLQKMINKQRAQEPPIKVMY